MHSPLRLAAFLELSRGAPATAAACSRATRGRFALLATRAFSTPSPQHSSSSEATDFAPAWQWTSEARRGALKTSKLSVPTTVEPDLSERCYLNTDRWEAPLTGLMIHGLMGNSSNWNSVMRRVCNRYTATTKKPIKIMLVDLRNHGDSTMKAISPGGSNSIAQCAADVVSLFERHNDLQLPNFVIGHSFGGKVALEFAKQAFLPPQKVICLDTCPTAVPANSAPGVPSMPELVKILAHIPMPVPSADYMKRILRHKYELSEGFTRWMIANLRQVSEDPRQGLRWKFNLDAIGDLFQSYQDYCAWDVIENPPADVAIDWVRAEKSSRWTPSLIDELESRVEKSGGLSTVRMLPKAGHWVHVDNPVGLTSMLVDTLTDL